MLGKKKTDGELSQLRLSAFVGGKPMVYYSSRTAGVGKVNGRRQVVYTYYTTVYYYTCSTVDSDYRGAGGPQRGWEGVATTAYSNPIREVQQYWYPIRSIRLRVAC